MLRQSLYLAVLTGGCGVRFKACGSLEVGLVLTTRIRGIRCGNGWTRRPDRDGCDRHRGRPGGVAYWGIR